MKNKIGYFILSTLMILFLSCSSDQDTDPIQNPPIEEQGSFEEFSETLNNFGFHSFLYLNQSEEGANLLISPLSIATALYMTMNGTDGQTLEEFRETLLAQKFYSNGINTHYETLLGQLESSNDAVQLNLNNALFYDDQYVDLNHNYIETVSDVYQVDIQDADFGDAATVDLINSWAEEKTEGKIKEVLKEIKKDEILFLINALYMLADWKNGFDPDLTQERPFIKQNGEVTLNPFVSSDANRRYTKNDDYSAVDMLFSGDEFSMTFVMPEDELTNYISSFDLSTFTDWYQELYQDLQEGRVQLCLPKFEIANKILLKDMLIDLGMETAFESANLDRMGVFYGGQTYLSRVIHDAFLKLDEKGIEGAAVTTVGVGNESLPPQLCFNKPFLFIIRHIETNTPIFIGKMGDPNS